MYKPQLKSNAETIVFFDVITQQKIYLVSIPNFSSENKIQRENFVISSVNKDFNHIFKDMYSSVPTQISIQ